MQGGAGVRLLLLAGLITGLVMPAVAGAQSTVRIVAYNIRHGQGTDDRVDLPRIAEVLRALDADVITLQEVDNRTERTGGVDQVQVLAEHMGYQGFHGAHRAYQGGEYGNAILTRLPVRSVRTHSIPPASGSALTVHEIEVQLPSGTTRTSTGEPSVSISVVSVHLAGTPEERTAQAEAVSAAFGGPAILAGDFNGRPDDTAVRRLARTWHVGTKRGDPRTYPAPEPDREIDFVMWRTGERAGAGDPIELRLADHWVVDEPMASDHRPLVAVFELAPAAGTRGFRGAPADGPSISNPWHP